VSDNGNNRVVIEETPGHLDSRRFLTAIVQSQ
jgi:hypothetical protein